MFSKKKNSNFYRFTRILLNFFITPWGYKKDYLISIINPKILVKKPLPWINYKAISYIELNDKAQAKVFEYGSGSSTLYWCSRGYEVVSIEHDRGFYNHLADKIQNLSVSIAYKLVEPELDVNCENYDPGSPDLFQSNDFRSHSFRGYVTSIDIYKDEYFDIVVVDGRARPSCIKHAISKVKKGGKLIIDNSDRTYYFKYTSDYLAGWQQKVFRGTVRGLLHQEQTSIFLKPA
jgi:hypothetical protein